MIRNLISTTIKYFGFLLPVLGLALEASAQQDNTLYFMPEIPQATYVNPATIPHSQINVGLPVLGSIYTSFNNRTFSWGDLFSVRNQDTVDITAGHIMHKVKDHNFFSANMQIDLLSAGYAINDNNYLSFNATEKFTSTLSYTRDFARFLWEGNGLNLIGKRASFDDVGADLSHYREYALGYAHKFNDKLTIGGKLKYLTGTENIYTARNKSGIYTHPAEETYYWHVDGDYDVRTSGIKSDGDVFKKGSNSSYSLGRGNHGFGMDLGASYQLNQRWGFSASVIDLGYIHWTNDIHNYTNKINTDFYGYNAWQPIINKDSTGKSGFSKGADSIKNLFIGGNKENNNAYTSYLFPMIHLAATYRVTDNATAGALLYTQLYKGYMRPGITLSYSDRMKSWFTGIVSYSYFYPGSWANLGLGFALNAGAFQFYAVSDNATAAIAPRFANDVHLRFGFNLTFKRWTPEALTEPETQEEQPAPDQDQQNQPQNKP